MSPSLPGIPESGVPSLITWESELRVIGRDAAAWAVETGGDLFGLWGLLPVVYLATRVGPNAVRDAAHFRLDVEYLRRLSDVLAADWGLRYFGDWHSHHRLGLIEPSTRDRRRIRRVAARNAFTGMAEIIVTFADSAAEHPSVQIHPWLYLGGHSARGAAVVILPGLSPVREALVARGALPEQEFDRWAELSLSRVLLPGGTGSAGEAPQGPADPMVRRLLDQARRVLDRGAGGPVEEHPSPFGCVLVVPAGSARSVAIAVGATWPCEILEVDWIDREKRSAEIVDVSTPTNLLVPDELLALHRNVVQLKNAEGADGDVDRSSA